MPYLGQIQKSTVWDARGAKLGSCEDVLVSGLDRQFPYVRALAVRVKGRGTQVLRADQIATLEPRITLRVARDALQLYAPRGDELWLVERILDRQIVDTGARRVVRVRDAQIAQVGDRILLTGVDVSAIGLFRRYGLGKVAERVARWLGVADPDGVIPWEAVAPLQQGAPIRLRISRDKISKLHPADIADLLNNLDSSTSHALITTLDDGTLADAMEEIPTDMQVAVVANLHPERAADVLEEMGPDEVADLLADLPQEQGESILQLMEADAAEDVRHLLRYEESTAGGIMTTEFATLPAGLTVGAALAYLRASEDAQDDEAMYHVYVVDEEHRLRGVISLRDLVMADPGADLAPLIQKPVTIGPATSQGEVAYTMAKYNLLSVPVVDEAGSLLGIVTVDDAIDAVLPTTWKRRLPRFF